MKTLCSIIISLFFCSLNCYCQKPAVTAHIEGLGNDSLLVRWESIDGEKTVEDTIVAMNGNFNYDIKYNSPAMVYIKPFGLMRKSYLGEVVRSNSRIIVFMVQPTDKIKIEGVIEPNYVTYKADGSQFNSDISSHREQYKSFAIKADSLNLLQCLYMYDPNLPADFVALPVEQRDSVIYDISVQMTLCREKSKAVQTEYIANNLGSDLAVYYILNMASDVFEKYYPTLTDQAKNGVFKWMLKERVKVEDAEKAIAANKSSMKEGMPAPEFILKNLKGENITLSSLKGKYVVLDFWGSWCSWCIKGIPDMKTYYAKHSSKVEFVGINCRDTESKWQASVKKHALPWTQLIDQTTDISESAVMLYAVEGFPTKIIISPDMKIVKVFKGESEDFYKELDQLLQ